MCISYYPVFLSFKHPILWVYPVWLMEQYAIGNNMWQDKHFRQMEVTLPYPYQLILLANSRTFNLEVHLFQIHCGSKLGCNLSMEFACHFHTKLHLIGVNSPEYNSPTMEAKRRWEGACIKNSRTVSLGFFRSQNSLFINHPMNYYTF